MSCKDEDIMIIQRRVLMQLATTKSTFTFRCYLYHSSEYHGNWIATCRNRINYTSSPKWWWRTTNEPFNNAKVNGWPPPLLTDAKMNGISLQCCDKFVLWPLSHNISHITTPSILYGLHGLQDFFFSMTSRFASSFHLHVILANPYSVSFMVRVLSFSHNRGIKALSEY